MYYQIFDQRINKDTNLPKKNINRAVALIQIGDKFVTFKKTKKTDDYFNDLNFLYLPGGKIENNEDVVETAKRETEEEIGLLNLNFVKIIETVKCYFDDPYQKNYFKNVETYILFTSNIKDFNNRKESELEEKDGQIYLATKEELIANNWSQLTYILNKIK